mmetsp:Transcript_8398/g.10614  ORF Transcript_8398/g.10614 Transcript_8398/m.10614 type:complete len:160 (-) Transcript_8398:648-1127(-)
MISSQAKIQGVLKPATWFPLSRNFHQEIQKWTASVEVERLFDSVVEAVGSVGGLSVDTVDKKGRFLKLHFLTPGGKWLDVYELNFSQTEETTEIIVKGSSSGILPMIIPCAPLLNVVLCLACFADGGKIAQTMKKLRKQVEESGISIDREIIQKSMGRP